MTASSLQSRMNSALTLFQNGRFDDAKTAFEAIIIQDPQCSDAYHLLGLLLCQTGHPDHGLDLVRRSIQMAPLNSQFRMNFVLALRNQGRLDEAIQAQQERNALKDATPRDIMLLAQMFIDTGRHREAEPLLKQVLDASPNTPQALLALGIINLAAGNVSDAIVHIKRAQNLAPDAATPHYNLGNALFIDRQIEAAKAAYREAIRINPNLSEAHAHLGKTLMLEGNLADGWPEYEWRWKGDGFPNRQAAGPLWDGKRLEGSTLLLTTEQGYGDAFQFIRFALQAKEASGAKIVVEAQSPIAELIASAPGVDDVVNRGTPLPAFNAQAPLMTLPAILKTNLDTLPAEVPYLSPASELRTHWAEELADLPKRKVGLIWRGNPDQLHNIYRSCPVEALAPLLKVDGINLIGLQKDPTAEELAHLPGLIDFGSRVKTFSDTAAIMANLDLVISVCTSTAHLSGALAKPTWVMLSAGSDWRWFLDRKDSPWYPTARLFRQRTLHDWAGLASRVATALSEWANAPLN